MRLFFLMPTALASATISTVAMAQPAEQPEAGQGVRAETASPIQTPLEVVVRARPRDDRRDAVDLSFATVTFVTARELLRNDGKSLGDKLSTQPGITNSGFAPGAAARPVIRGLDNFRVRIQENGIGAGDVSDLGEDHGVPIDPLAAQRVEVIRGPATLRYGAAAIGGVVSVENDRIATVQRPPGVSVETRGAASSVDRGIEAATLMQLRYGQFVIHGDIYARRSEDYSIPRSAGAGGKQLNSFVRSNGQALGGTYFLPENRGYMGISFSRFASIYGIPGNDAPTSRTRIDMEQFKLNGKGEIRVDSNFVEMVRYWFGGSVYKHTEEGLNGVGLFEPGAVFKNRELEGRIEFQLVPWKLPIGESTTTVGVQFGRQKIGTAGEAGGLLQPASTQTAAAYLFNEIQLQPTTRLQAAARADFTRVRGNGAIFPADFLGASGPEIDDPRIRRFTAFSASLGVLQDLPFGFTGSVTGQFVQRAPRAAELFSRGAHDAPGTFEIGDPNLRKETAKTIEIGLRKAAGPFRFAAAAFATHYDGFIYRRGTGILCDDDFASCGTGTELRQVVYSQRNARFLGAEVKGQYDAFEVGTNVFGVEAQYDIVRAKFSGGERVPRIPPQRIGGGVFWRGGDAWFAKVNLIHAFGVKKIAPEETPTKGYNLLNAELSYRFRLANSPAGPVDVIAGISGTNLLNSVIRNHVSFRKDEVVAPGRGIRGFVNVKF